MEKTEQKPDLRDLTALGVQDLLVDLGEKPFRARQVLRWLYKDGVSSFDDMSDLSKSLRARLKDAASISLGEIADAQTSKDGTRKFLHRFNDGGLVESVLMPEEDHSTLCVSSQIGCRMGCRFCRTATLGFKRNLTPSEIMAQVLLARKEAAKDKPLTNLVFMGMGEPLDNLSNLVISLDHILGEYGLQMSQRKVTVSTAGRVDMLPALAKASPCALAVSLNAPNDEIRRRLMPINQRFNLAALHEALSKYPLKPTRRITLEYVLLKGVNDQPEHARELAAWVHGLKVKVNLIALNSFDGGEFSSPDPDVVNEFKEMLADRHVTALLRKPRGDDISAACGMLAAKA